MKTTSILVLTFWVIILSSWGCNAYKLTKCDFEKPFKGEVIHAIGLIPILSIFTVWSEEK